MQLVKEKWENDDFLELQEYLREQADEKYRLFNEKILNTEEATIGIRIPTLRKMAKEIAKGNFGQFMAGFKPKCHEEKMLFCCILTEVPLEYDAFLVALDEFLPQISNWALCDILCGNFKKPIRKHKEEFFAHIMPYLSNSNPWIIRVGIVALISQYIDEKHLKECFLRIDSISNSFYYVQIAQAWFIATAMAKFPDETKEYLKICKASDWVFNKAIQKSRESYRVSEGDKALLLQWKRSKTKD